MPGCSKKRYPKKTDEKGGGHIDPTPGEIGLSLWGNIKVKETDTITFTSLWQTLKVYECHFWWLLMAAFVW